MWRLRLGTAVLFVLSQLIFNKYWRTLVILANCVEYYCYKLNSMEPVVYWYDAGIQEDNKEGG